MRRRSPSWSALRGAWSGSRRRRRACSKRTIAALGAALDHLEDARRGLEAAMRACDFDPSELERTEERLFALRAAARKHQVPVDDLAGARRRLFRAALRDRPRRLRASRARRLRPRRRCWPTANAADLLSTRRAAAAKALEKAVNAELPALKLEAARFIVAREIDDGGRVARRRATGSPSRCAPIPAPSPAR